MYTDRQELSQGRYESLRVQPKLIDIVEQALSKNLSRQEYPYFGEMPLEEQKSEEDPKLIVFVIGGLTIAEIASV